jgi:hypothetical protein
VAINRTVATLNMFAWFIHLASTRMLIVVMIAISIYVHYDLIIKVCKKTQS